MTAATFTVESGAEMPRKNAGYRLDERCISALKVLAERTGVSVNEYLETLLFEHAKVQRVIAPSEERLGETRGRKKENGQKSGAGRPKANPEGDTDGNS
jgi:prolyl-tRNA editing enzyme YbaK/EbsC (Cys-tRNA(Pro) deacylase)